MSAVFQLNYKDPGYLYSFLHPSDIIKSDQGSLSGICPKLQTSFFLGQNLSRKHCPAKHYYDVDGTSCHRALREKTLHTLLIALTLAE